MSDAPKFESEPEPSEDERPEVPQESEAAQESEVSAQSGVVRVGSEVPGADVVVAVGDAVPVGRDVVAIPSRHPDGSPAQHDHVTLLKEEDYAEATEHQLVTQAVSHADAKARTPVPEAPNVGERDEATAAIEAAQEEAVEAARQATEDEVGKQFS